MILRKHRCEDCEQIYTCIKCSEYVEDATMHFMDRKIEGESILYHPSHKVGTWRCDECIQIYERKVAPYRNHR